MFKPLLGLVSLTALVLAGCSHTRTISTGDGTVTVESKGKDEGSLHITAKDGTTMDVNTGKPITDYPADVPLYEGKSVMDMKTGEKNARVVSVQTSDSMDKVVGFYKTKLDSKGWKTESSLATEQMHMMTAKKDDKQLVVTITSDGKMQTISQQFADK